MRTTGERRWAELEWYIADGNIPEEIAAYTLLVIAAGAVPIPATMTWTIPFAPTDELTHQLLFEVSIGLLFMHPSTPPQVDVWKKTFDRAWSDAKGDPAALEDPELENMDLRWATWYAPAPAGPDLGPAEETLADHLRRRLHPSKLAGPRATELLIFTADLLVEEALRTFDFWLNEYEIPVIRGRQFERFREVTRTALQTSDLTHVLQMIWQAVEGVRNVVRKHGARTRSYFATEYAVRRVEHYASSGIGNVIISQAVHEYLTTQPLSAVTQTLFGSVLALEAATLPVSEILANIETWPLTLSTQPEGASDEGSPEM